jgi:hypothetical protein
MNAITTVEDKPKRQLIEVVDPIPVLDTSRFEHMQRIANVMAQSTLIPESLYKEKDGELPLTQIISNCFLVVNQAVRWGLDPFAVAQSVAVVRGKLCYEGKLVSAVLDAKLGVRLHHHFTGDPTKPEYRIYISDQPWTEESIAAVKPGMTLPGARIIDGSVADWQTGDKSPWAAIKNYRRMLIYRGTRDWARFYEPAVLLGVYTPDEMIELAEGARAARAREIEQPSVMQRLQARQEAPQTREGFDQSFVTRETAALTGEADSEEDNTQSSEAPSPSDEGSDGSPSSTVAADLSPGDELGTEEGAPEATEPEKPSDGQAVAPSSDLSAEDREWLLSVAKQLWAATGIGEQELVSGVATDLRNKAPEAISQSARAKALSIVKQCKLVCFGEQEAADTLEIVAGIAGVETKDIV